MVLIPKAIMEELQYVGFRVFAASKLDDIGNILKALMETSYVAGMYPENLGLR